MNTYQTSTVLAHHSAYFRIVGNPDNAITGDDDAGTGLLSVVAWDGARLQVWAPNGMIRQYANRPGVVLEVEGRIGWDANGFLKLHADAIAVIISDDDVHTPASEAL